ncbi:MAG: MFS transporter [Myxococcota bacterium]|nr:MFS transporter [Myxococcota bacterium]
MPLLFFTIFNSILGLSVLFPILGPLGRELGLAETQVGAMSTSYALMQLLLSTWWGRKSETAGRKKILLVGVIGFALAFGLLGVVAEIGRAGLVPNLVLFALMLAARFIGGAFASAMLPTAQAYAADITSAEKRTSGMAVIGAAFGLAIVFGPVIGGVLAHFFGLTAPIWFSTGFGVLNALLVWRRLPEPPARAPSTRAPAALRDVAHRAWPLLAVAAVATSATVMMEQTIAFLMEDRLHLTHDETPIWMAGGLFVYGVVAVAVQGGLVRRVRIAPTMLVRLGLPLTIAGLLTMMLAHDYAWIVVGMALQGFGQGLALPGVTSAMSLAVDDSEQGAIAGLNNSAQGLGRLFGPLVGTSLYELHRALPYGAGAALIGIVLLFVIASPQMRAITARHREALQPPA